jgi:hypothetical protein
MEHWNLQDMKRDGKGDGDAAPPLSRKEPYPWGLCIHLTHEDLETLGLDCDVEPGDYLHGMFFAKVTSVSTRTHDAGADARVELQITHLALENESTEDGEDEEY